jgi:hypothetical protein
MGHKFTDEQAKFLKDHVEGRGNVGLTEMFNAHFGLNLGVNQIKAYKKNHKLSSGLDGRFNKGHPPANKGRKGVDGWEPTQFKKGHKPWNYQPVGTERVNTDGYVDVKIADPNKWRAKHVLLWEAANGPVPQGHVLIFGDGDKTNVELDNILLVSRKQLVRLNQHSLIQNDTELTRTGILIADIYNKIGQRKRRSKSKGVQS